jgi:hypothetical protein
MQDSESKTPAQPAIQRQATVTARSLLRDWFTHAVLDETADADPSAESFILARTPGI